MKTNFKFGRTYDKDKDDNKFFMWDINLPRVSAYANPRINNYCYKFKDETNGHYLTPPQKDLKTIKKFHYKGKYPKPRNL